MLESIKVVDLTRALAGPTCTQLMAGMGAEVIKVEPPGGDFTRIFAHLKDGYSGYFLQRNHDKKSVCIDLREEAGREIVRELVAVSDVVVENYRAGVMKRLGLAFDDLVRINPNIVMCSISGYGQEGRYSARSAGDHAIQASTGLMWMTGEADGPPTWGGSAYTDIGAGLHAFGAICAALLRLQRTGRGEWIDVALFDCAFWQHEFAVEQALLSQGTSEPKRMGNRRLGASPSGVYRARDGYAALVISTDAGWGILAGAIGRPELGQDPRFATHDARWAHADEVDALIEGWMAGVDSVDEVVTILADRFGLPCAKVMTVTEALDDEYVRERGLLAEVEDRVLGKATVQRAPVRFASGNRTPVASAPLLGEHTGAVLRDMLGYSQERVLELLGDGVIEVDGRVLDEVVGGA